MQFVALPYFVNEQTGSAFATALTAAAQVLPGITLGPVAGALADRRDSRRLLIGANLILAVVTLAFCLAVVGPWWIVVVVAFAQAVVAQLAAPAEVVLVPALVPLASLAAANSLSAANNSLARLIGPAAGGLLYAAAGLHTVAVANAASFAIAALLVSRIDASTSTRAPAEPGRPPRHPGTFWLRLTAGWPAGWNEIRSQRLLGRLLVFVVLTGLGEGCVSALLAPYVAEVFGNSTALGLLLTCQAAGGVVGAIVMSRHAAVDRLPRTLGAAATICGVLLAVMIGYPLLYPQLWPALVLITVAGLPFAAVAAAQITLLQTLPDPGVRGSVFGVTIAAAGAAQLTGILTAGYLADQLTVFVLLADAPCYLLAGLIIISQGRQRPSARTRRR